MRWLAVAAGVALLVFSLIATTQVADTRQGLLIEIVTLTGWLAGVGLVLAGWFLGRRTTPGRPAAEAVSIEPGPRVHSANELLMGGGGIVLAAVLLSGLAYSGGTLWALLGFFILLPMVVGCAYLCFAFVRGPVREWRIDVRKLTRIR